VFAITRQTLTDLADANLEEQIIAIFLVQLRELDEESQKILSYVISTSSRPALVRSNFSLHNTQKKQIENTLRERFATDIEVDFETSSEIIAGIELVINGQKLAWNIAQYLGSLEKNLQQLAQRPLSQEVDNKKLSETEQSPQYSSLQQQTTAAKASHRDD
jgi:F-type H+-transporting ATPase subunit b